MVDQSGPAGPAVLRRRSEFIAAMDGIGWGELNHAYGAATDIPGLLSSALHGGSETDRALHELWGNIHHQGTIYAATGPCVPFLGYLARASDLTDEQRLQFLFLLFVCARSRGYLEVDTDVLERLGFPDDAPRATAEVRAAVAREAQICLADLTQLTGSLWRATAILIAVAGSASGQFSNAVSDPPPGQSDFVRAAMPLLTRLSTGEALPVSAIGGLLEQDEELAFFWAQRVDDAAFDGVDLAAEKITLESSFVDVLAERVVSL